MKLKRYIVNSMPEALQKIRMELGEQAIILSTKEIRSGGFLGFLSRKKIEVTAAVDEKRAEDLVPTDWKSEINDIKNMIHQLAQSKTDEQIEVLNEVRLRLLAQDFSPSLTTRLIENAEKSLNDKQDKQSSLHLIYQSVRQQLQNILDERSVVGISSNRKIVNFVGPTGVGKTTTIAKLAADQAINQQRKVGFITADTYRIAAIEQLRTYAGILNVPMEVVHSPQDLRIAMDRLAHCDIIFMDTAGRNYRNEMHVSELNNLLDVQDESETYLVLSLTMKYTDMEMVASRFAKVKLDRVLFTKYDETNSVGAVFHLLDTYKLPLSYMTFGQNVPDDIEKINTKKLVDQVMEGLEYE